MSTSQKYLGGGSYARTSDQTAKKAPISEPAADKRQVTGSIPYCFELELDTKPVATPNGRSEAHVILSALTHYRDHVSAGLEKEIQYYVENPQKGISGNHNQDWTIAEHLSVLRLLNSNIDLIGEAIIWEFRDQYQKGGESK